MASAATVRVKRGAKWLDENFPGWEKRINIKTLDLEDGNKCICGQVFKKPAKKEMIADGYQYAVDTLFTEANKWINGIVRMATQTQGNLTEREADTRAGRVAVALGFESGPVFNEWDDDAPKNTESSDFESIFFSDLQKAWEKLLAKRTQPVDN